MLPTRQFTLIQGLVLLLALLLTGCGAPGASTTAPAADLTTAHAPATSPEYVEFNGIGFSYDRSLAQRVKPRHVPAGEHMGFQLPEYVEFDFDPDHTNAFPGRDTGIRVFRVRDLAAVDWMYEAGVAAREPMPLVNATL